MSAVESFELPGWQGELRADHRPLDLAAAIERLADPGAASETIHWGRNYLYSMELETEAGPLDVVVKQFRNQGFKARWRRRFEGSKAEKSWRVARYMEEHSVLTPEPVLLLESVAPDGASLYVTRRLVGGFEARYFFRALNAGRESEDFPRVDVDGLLEAMGRSLRSMHDSGIWHRDVSVGNLLITANGNREPEVHIVDLNRARIGQSVSVQRRTRDLCRLRIFRQEHQDTFLRAYWQGRDRSYAFKRRLYGLYHGSFLLRNRTKAFFRSPLGALRPRRAHAHIPPAAEDAGARDLVAWDHLSDQPHQHASRLQRLGVRLADLGAHGKEFAAGARALPRILNRYRRLKKSGSALPVAFDGLGVALRPWPEAPDRLLESIEELGVRKILLRLHPWAEHHDDEETLAAELSSRGYDLAYSLPQNRELVRNPTRWCQALDELAARFTPFGKFFQVGQAVNRSKWGVWRYDEYQTLVAAAREAFAPYPEAKLLGPAVIDFEFYATAAILNLRWRPELALDGVASLLYVDRRGAPENTQLGLDTVGKVTLLKAIVQTARNSADRNWITEVNWPLWEGPHSPAGRKVSVDEETQANYLVRYYLLALGTGLVERVYWWQLVARGYGLMAPEDDGRLRGRPSYRALAALARQVGGAHLIEVHEAPEVPAGAYLYSFRDSGGQRRAVAWSAGEPLTVELPSRATAAWTRDGEPKKPPSSTSIEVSGSPSYFAFD